MKINLTPVTSKLFTQTVSDDDIILSAEISDLGANNIFQFLYDNASDIGFAMKSERTGQVVTFVLKKTERDNDGDTLFWSFVPAKELNKGVVYSTNKHLSVTIFND